MKHNIYLISLFLFTLFSCGRQQNNTVHIEGEIDGLGNDTLYLYGDDRTYTRIDTIPVRKDRFSVTLAVDTLTVTWMQFKEGMRYPVFIDRKEKITVKGDTAQADRLRVYGNPSNDELTAFMDSIDRPAEASQEERAAAFISSHPASLANIYLLERFFVHRPEPDGLHIKQLIERMTGELKDRSYIESLLGRVQEEEKSAIGRSMPFFHLPDSTGRKVHRTDFKAQYIWIHFWASWDTTSRKELEMYRRIHREEAKNKQFAMLGISLDMDRKSWTEAIRNDTLTWTQVCDFSGWNTEVVKQLSLRNLPANILIAPNGRIEGKNLDEAGIRQQIEKIKEKP